MQTVPLLQSRSFWTLVIDLVVSLLTYFLPKFLAPEYATDALWLIAALQPMYIFLVVRFTVEDVALIKSGHYNSKFGVLPLQ